GAVDLTDRRLEVVACLREIVALRLQELEALTLLCVLLDGEHVDRTEPLDVGGNPLQLGAEHVRIAVDDLRLLHQLLERATPLGLETLAHAALRRLRLGALDLAAVTQLAALVGRAAQASQLRLQLDRTFGGLRQGVVQLTPLEVGSAARSYGATTA